MDSRLGGEAPTPLDFSLKDAKTTPRLHRLKQSRHRRKARQASRKVFLRFPVKAKHGLDSSRVLRIAIKYHESDFP